jgi:putrescine transport system permease protein
LRPDINALATIIIIFVAILVAIAAFIMLRQQKRELIDQQMAARGDV